MKMSYEKPVIEVRNYSLEECITTSLAGGGDIIDPGLNTASDELFK